MVHILFEVDYEFKVFKWVRSYKFIFDHYGMSFVVQFPTSLCTIWYLWTISSDAKAHTNAYCGKFSSTFSPRCSCTAVNAVCILVGIMSTAQCKVRFLEVWFVSFQSKWINFLVRRSLLLLPNLVTYQKSRHAYNRKIKNVNNDDSWYSYKSNHDEKCYNCYWWQTWISLIDENS